MKSQLISFYKHPLISGSAVIFIGSNISFVLIYIFNLILGRFLSVTDYGVYATLISFLSLFGIFPSTFTQIFTKFAAMYKAKGEEEKMSALFIVGFRIIAVFGGALFFLLLLGLPFITSFLHITNPLLLLLIFVSLFLSLIMALPNGVLQGQIRLYALSFVTISTPFFKILIGFLLLFLGWQVLGVTVAIVVSSLITIILLAFLFRHAYTKQAITKQDTFLFFEEFRKYSIQFFLSAIGLTILQSTDMIFVKHLFSAEKAGQYAALAVMGRSIFYFTSPIYLVFFPLIAQKKERDENIHRTLLLAICIITLCTVSLSFFYFLFPTVILKIFYPAPAYNVLTSYLGPFSLYIIIFSIAMLFNSFLLSIGKNAIYKINGVVASIFLILMSLFHSSFYQIIGVLFFTSFLLLALQVIYYVSSLYGKK